MNWAIRTSRFDRPPQSCVVSVIWTCVNTEASALPRAGVLSSQGQIEPKLGSFAALALIQPLKAKDGAVKVEDLLPENVKTEKVDI